MIKYFIILLLAILQSNDNPRFADRDFVLNGNIDSAVKNISEQQNLKLVQIDAINDAPVVTSMSVQINEGENIDIELDGSDNILVCNNNLSDNNSILCNCSHESLVGGCDVEGTENNPYQHT